MKKKTSIFFKPIDGTAPLSMYFYDGMLGDAIEANNEAGVGWFSPNGEILAMQFDEVSENKDHQILEFDGYKIEWPDWRTSFFLQPKNSRKCCDLRFAVHHFNS